MSTRTRRRTLRARLLAIISDAVQRLVQAWLLLTGAQTRLLNALSRIRPGRGATRAIQAATAVFQRSLGAFDRAVAGFAERWAAQDLPRAYQQGALAMLDHVDRPHATWSWTPRHQEAITSLTTQFYVDLMARLQEALRRARVFLRDARDRAREAAVHRALLDPEQLLQQHPLGTVIYANEHRHPVEAWAHAALSGQTVTTANTGGIRTAMDELGVDRLEVRDGSGCGWSDHEDADKANGTLRTVQDALAHPIAHPNCVREFLPYFPPSSRNILGAAA